MSHYNLYLDLILELVGKIERSLNKSLSDDDIWDATLMRFQVIGENIKNIPEKTLKKHSEINWEKFYGFRNDINHEYLKVPETIVRSLINELPAMKRAIKKIRSELK
jgi:uncharacterized protein with HEPN domain